MPLGTPIPPTIPGGGRGPAPKPSTRPNPPPPSPSPADALRGAGGGGVAGGTVSRPGGVTPVGGTAGGYDWSAPAGNQIGKANSAFEQVFTLGGRVGSPTSQEDYWTQQMGADWVARVKATGLDPNVYQGLGPKAQQAAGQWGTNLGNGIMPAAIEAGQARQTANEQANKWSNDLIAQFDLQQTAGQDRLGGSITGDRLSATARYDQNVSDLARDLGIDLGLLGERQFRDVGLERQGVAIDQNYLNTMRDVAGQRYGLVGEGFQNQEDYLNQMIQSLNGRRGTAYDQFQTNDAYAAQQGVDNAKQYGFNARDYQSNLQGAIGARDTAQRNATSDATARGAFGSAGYRDDLGDIAGQFGLATDNAALSRDRTNLSIEERDRGIGNSRQNAGFGYQNQVAGFDETQFGYDRSFADAQVAADDAYQQYRGQIAGYDKDQGGIDQRGKALDSIAREYGLRKEDMQNQFNSAITRQGLDLADTNRKLDEMLASGNAQIVQQGIQFMTNMMAFQ